MKTYVETEILNLIAGKLVHQIHVPATLLPEKEPHVTHRKQGCVVLWVTQTASGWRRREKSLYLLGIKSWSSSTYQVTLLVIVPAQTYEYCEDEKF